MKKIMPIIISDIDGVLLHNNKAIAKAQRTLKILRSPLQKIDPINFPNCQNQIPLVFLTNNCIENQLEYEKADYLNSIFQLTKEKNEFLTAGNIICNYTIMQKLMKQYQDQIVLLCGLENVNKIIVSWEIQNYLTMEEYATLYPQLVPVSKRDPKEALLLRPKIKDRIQFLKDENFQTPLPISSIFVLGDCIRWEEHSQIICDLLSMSNGRIASKLQTDSPINDQIPIYWANSAKYYGDNNNISRIGSGMFRIALETCYKLIYDRNIQNIHTFGKPQIQSFQSAYQKSIMQTDLEPGNIYMIGDSILNDIQSANQLGWQTILIKSSLSDRLHENAAVGSPAKFVVRDFEEAIKLIYKREGFIFDNINF